MKALEMNQMEIIEGGSCAGAYGSVTLLLLGVAAVSGPVGWAVVGAFAVGGLLAGAEFAEECVL